MHHRPLLPATALSLALTSCAVPFADTAPGSNPAAPASVASARSSSVSMERASIQPPQLSSDRHRIRCRVAWA